MAVAESGRRMRGSWMMWAFWAAGVALLLVEVNAGMEYVNAGLQQNMANLLGWAPALGMITLKMAEQSIWHWSVLAVVLRAVPLAATGLLLVTFGLAMNRQIGSASKQSAKE